MSSDPPASAAVAVGVEPRLEGMHHITMITGDAQANVDFYAGVLGLRLVKKTVNFDAPDMYHLYYGDDAGSPGSVLTWFEIRGARAGRAGDGMIHTIELGVPGAASLDYWRDRLTSTGVKVAFDGDRLAFVDYDGLGYALVPSTNGNAPLQATTGDVPREHAIIGVEGARAYSSRPERDHAVLVEAFGFERVGGVVGSAEAGDARDGGIPHGDIPPSGDDDYLLRGYDRSFRWSYDAPPKAPGINGAGTVHHIAWCSRDDEQVGWQERARAAGLHVTPVVDRDYFTAVYTRVPSGIMFEVATMGPGFAVDEDPARLGEGLRVPKQFASMRDQIEGLLTPITVPSER